jgi:HlyD family secretion protein
VSHFLPSKRLPSRRLSSRRLSSRRLSGKRLVPLALIAVALGCQPAVAERTSQAAAPGEGHVSPSRLLLTGEIDAAAGQVLAVPRVPQWNVTLRWIEKDGAMVKQGQKVAELDDSVFTAELTKNKIAAAQARADLLHQRNESAILALDKRFEVEQARLELEKARLVAAVDADSYPLRVYQENQLELRRREVALATALDAERAHEKSAALEARVMEIGLSKREREIKAAEDAIAALSLYAPRDGIVITEVHPWFRRKVQSGDNVWVNFALMRLPDLATLEVRARLSDVDDTRVEPGMRVMTYLDAYPDLGFPGTIQHVSPVAREMSRQSLRRSFAVGVSFDQIDLSRMLPGMSVRVEVAEGSPVSQAAGSGS